MKYPDGEAATTYVGSLYEETGARATRHIYLGDVRVASVANGEVFYNHADHLGGTNVVTDENGVMKEMIEYLPFGKINEATHWKDQTPEEIAFFRFSGQRLDDEVGLMYYGARYYDPDIGRFITPDEVVQDAAGRPQTLNRYTYAGNNPVLNTDPSGHFFGIFVAIVKAVVAYAVEHAAAIAIGAAIGAVGAAATGGNIGLGALTGAIGGGIFGGIGSLGWEGLGAVGLHAAGGAATGAISAVITGGDPVKGALIGGISAGVTQFAGQHFSFLSGKTESFKEFSGAFFGRAVIGAVLGGAASVATGGSFGEGAKIGGITAGIAFLGNDSLHKGGYLQSKLSNVKVPEFVKSIGRALNFKRIFKHKQTAEANENMNPTSHQHEAWEWGAYVGDEQVAGTFRTLGEMAQFVGYSTQNAVDFYVYGTLDFKYATFTPEYFTDSVLDIGITQQGAVYGKNEENPY